MLTELLSWQFISEGIYTCKSMVTGHTRLSIRIIACVFIEKITNK